MRMFQQPAVAIINQAVREKRSFTVTLEDATELRFLWDEEYTLNVVRPGRLTVRGRAIHAHATIENMGEGTVLLIYVVFGIVEIDDDLIDVEVHR